MTSQIILTNGAAPSTPAAGKTALFVEDNTFKLKTSDGTVTPVIEGSSALDAIQADLDAASVPAHGDATLTFPEVILLGRNTYYPRAFLTAGRTWAQAVQAAIDTAAAAGGGKVTWDATQSSYAIRQDQRLFLKNNVDLHLNPDVLITPVHWTLIGQGAASGAFGMTVTGISAVASVGDGVAIQLANGTVQGRRITSMAGDTISWSGTGGGGALPSAASNGGFVTSSWANQGNNFLGGILNVDSLTSGAILGGRLDGQRALNPYGQNYGIVVAGASSYTIEDIDITGMASNGPDGVNGYGNGGDGVILKQNLAGTASRDIQISNVSCTYNDRTGLAATYCDGFRVQGSRFHYNKPADGTNGNLGAGITVEADTTDRLNNGIITGSTFTNNYMGVSLSGGTNGLTPAGPTNQSADTIVSNNYFNSNLLYDISARGYRNRIISNRIRFSTSTAIQMLTARGCHVENNDLVCTGSDASRYGVEVIDSEDFQITNNEIWSTYGPGIRINQKFGNLAIGTSKNGLIANNNLRNCGDKASGTTGSIMFLTSATATVAGVPAQSHITNIKLLNNHVYHSGTGAAQLDYAYDAQNVNLAADRQTWISAGNTHEGPASFGTGINQAVSQTASLTFAAAPSTVPGNIAQTTTVNGVGLGDTVRVTLADAAVPANYLLTGHVTAANTVSVTWTQISGAAAVPISGAHTYQLDIIKH